jgi:uncharacterized protein (DUF983 family)
MGKMFRKFVKQIKTRIILQMLKKGSKLYSILTGSCPRCHQESMYEVKNPYKLATLYKMEDKCGHCGLQYQVEPSFFYGAMYVSYGLTVAIGVAVFVSLKLFFILNVNQYLFAVILGILVLMPITARLARNIYINMFVGYKANWKSFK